MSMDIKFIWSVWDVLKLPVMLKKLKKFKYSINVNVYLYKNHQTSYLINEILCSSGINCYAEVLNLLILY